MDFKTATPQELRDEALRRKEDGQPWIRIWEPLEELCDRGLCTDCLQPSTGEYCPNRNCTASYGG